MDRSGPDKEGWEEVLKLDLAAGEWGGGLSQSHGSRMGWEGLGSQKGLSGVRVGQAGS